ncbi:MAG: hypothetical protein IJT31_00795, partial [Oscillibacter sp.]|nr:hypothetical protein [Oscillibacter sp.]
PEARVKGRGLLYYDERILEFQTALAAPSKDGRIGVEPPPDGEANPPIEAPERNERIKAAVRVMRAAWHGTVARPIPRIPSKPVREDFAALPDYRAALDDETRLPVAYNYEDASVYSLDLVHNFTYLVTGSRGSGKSVFMRNLMLACSERGEDVHIIEVRSSQYQWLAQEHGWKRYADAESIADFFTWLREECILRNPGKVACRNRNASPEELFEAAQVNPRINLFITTPLALSEELTKIPIAETPAPAKSDESAEAADDMEAAADGAEAVATNDTEAVAENETEAAADSAEYVAMDSAETADDAETVSADSAETVPTDDADDTEAAPAEKLRLLPYQQMAMLETVSEFGVGINFFLFVEASDKDLENNLTGHRWFSLLADYRSGVRFGGMVSKQSLLPFQNMSYRDAGYDSSVRPGIGFIPTDRQDEPKTRIVVPLA